MYNPTLRVDSSVISMGAIGKIQSTVSSLRDGLFMSFEKQESTSSLGCTQRSISCWSRALALSILRHDFTPTGRLGASASAGSRHFIALGLRTRRSTAAAAPSIGANFASVVAAAYWGTTSSHPVAHGGSLPLLLAPESPLLLTLSPVGSATAPLHLSPMFMDLPFVDCF
jgi:hypothetical protein